MNQQELDQLFDRFFKLGEMEKLSVYSRLFGYISADVLEGEKKSIEYMEYIKKTVDEQELKQIKKV